MFSKWPRLKEVQRGPAMPTVFWGAERGLARGLDLRDKTYAELRINHTGGMVPPITGP